MIIHLKFVWLLVRKPLEMVGLAHSFFTLISLRKITLCSIKQRKLWFRQHWKEMQWELWHKLVGMIHTKILCSATWIQTHDSVGLLDRHKVFELWKISEHQRADLVIGGVQLECVSPPNGLASCLWWILHLTHLHLPTTSSFSLLDGDD